MLFRSVEGPNLRDLIAAGPLSVKEALGLTAQVLRPLGAAHRAGHLEAFGVVGAQLQPFDWQPG